MSVWAVERFKCGNEVRLLLHSREDANGFKGFVRVAQGRKGN